MKKIYLLIALWLITLLFAGCGAAGNTPNTAMAAKCLVAVKEAESTEEINDYLTADTQALANLFVLGFPGDSYKVEVRYCGSYEDYDVFYYEARIPGNATPLDTDYALLRREGNRYRICANPTVVLEMTQNCLCHDCGGLGVYMTGNYDICKTCNGQGILLR